MIRKLRNVTITLDEETARWVRVEAARRDTSVSRMLGEILRRERERDDAYATAMDRYLGQAPGRHGRKGAAYPSRDELHDRSGLR